jgi:hypothetical protein
MMGIVTKVALKILATSKSFIFWHSFYMSISSSAPISNTSIWAGLKQAISASSGFQHWALQLSEIEQADLNLDARIQRYLRETLETLAY